MGKIREVLSKLLSNINLPKSNIPSQLDMHKSVIYIGVLIICIFTTSMLTTSLVSSYYKKLETEKQITEMQSFLDEWKQKNNQLNESTMRPVVDGIVDKVQTDVIFRSQVFNINLESIKELKQKEKNGRVYSIEFTGAYDNAMKFIQSLQDTDALVGLKHIIITAKNGGIKVKLTYKVYTK